jgi:hypothetical protein
MGMKEASEGCAAQTKLKLQQAGRTNGRFD